MKLKLFYAFLISITLCLKPNDYTSIVTFSEEGPSSSGTGVTIEGTKVTITTEGEYLITGNSTEGNLIISNNSVKLYLKNLNLTSNITAPIIINSKLNDILINSLENVILIDNESINTTVGECAVIKIKKNSEVTFENQKDFTLKGTCKNIIKGGVQTSIKFGKSNGEYIIEGYKNGISSDHYLEFNGGIFKIKTETGDAIKSSPDDNDSISEGKIVINDGTFDIESFSDAFQAKKIIYINNGIFDIKTENGYDSKTFDGDTMSAKGFKVSNNETGCEMVIKNGNFTLNTADDAFHSNGNMTIINGVFEIYTGDDAVHAEFNLNIGEKNTTNGPTINILSSYEGIEARYIDIFYGKIDLETSDDAINAAGGSSGDDPGPPPDPTDSDHRPPGPPPSPSGDNDFYISIHDGIINVLCKGDGIDSNGAINIDGGIINVFSQGPDEGFDNEPIDHDGNFNLMGGEILCGGNKGLEYVHEGITKGNQKYAYYTKNINASHILKIKDSEGKEIKSVTIPKKIGYVFYTSPSLNDKFKFYLFNSDGGNETEISFNFGSPSDDKGNGDNINKYGMKKLIFGIALLLILF